MSASASAHCIFRQYQPVCCRMLSTRERGARWDNGATAPTYSAIATCRPLAACYPAGSKAMRRSGLHRRATEQQWPAAACQRSPACRCRRAM
eukprot:2777981-Prymnesium_polylepis.1